MPARITVLIPSCDRPNALAVTLTGLCFQECQGFAVVISDQSNKLIYHDASIQTAIRLLEKKGHPVRQLANRPRRGLAQQRQFLLDFVASHYCLYLDDDVLLEPFVIGNMLQAQEEEYIGFVGQALIGLSYGNDYRPHQQAIELWEGPVEPELVTPQHASWLRHALHNAANVLHVQKKMKLSSNMQRKYKVAWVGAVCCMTFKSCAKWVDLNSGKKYLKSM